VSDREETPWRSLRETGLPAPAASDVSLSRRQVVLVFGGVGLVVAGVVGVVAPGVVADLDLPTLLVFLVALLALGFASRSGYKRLRRGERATSFEVVETRRDVARPGADLDEYLREGTRSNTGDSVKGYRVSQGHHARKMLRRHVEALAERVVQHRDRVDEETARTAVERGAWTADPAARSLFTDEPNAEAADGADDAPETAAPTAATTAPREAAASTDDGEPGYEVAEGGDMTTATAGERRGAAQQPPATSGVSPLPAVSTGREGGIGLRVSKLIGGEPDFRTGIRHATASLAAGVPGVSGDDLDGGRRLVDAGDLTWREGVWDTEHWRGVGSIGLLLVGLGALAEAPTLALAATVYVGYAGYAWLLSPPIPDLAVERTFDPPDPTPGDRVTVTVTVENRGDGFLPDCRLVDQVPDRLAVVAGSARHATALSAGETATFSYDLLAVAGSHDFDELAVAVRDASGQRERSTRVQGDGRTLTCEPAPVTESVPLHPQASGIVGRVPADAGGSGTSFHTVREYRRGDPLDRIDWNRKARTGELGTLQFDEEHAATVVVVVDVREAAALAPGPASLSALDRGLGGASQLVDTLLADGDRVGLATLGLDWTYVRPGTGQAHRADMQALLEREEMRASRTAGYSFNPARYRRRVKRRLPSDAQIVLFSPLCDDDSLGLARWFHARGHRVTVFSPDPTGTGSIGGVLVAIERTLNLSSLRSAGIRVVDWPPDGSLQMAVDRAQGRWSA
jgi:uncharacterized repeat protein (TIGR01451 family)